MAFAVALSWTPLDAAGAELSYEGPSDCPPRDELEFKITRALGKPLASVAPSKIVARVNGGAARYQALLRFELDAASAPSERTLHAPSCSQLFDALSVAIVLALGEIDRESSEVAAAPRAGVSTSAPPPESSVPKAPELPRDVDVAPASVVDDGGAGVKVDASLWFIGDAGSLPSFAPGAGLGAGLGAARWRVRALVAAWLEQHADLQLPTPVTPGADLSLFLGVLFGCYVPDASWGRVSLAACVSWETGLLSGRGTQLRQPLTGKVLWFAPGAALEARWQLDSSNLYLSLQLGASVPLNQSEFVLGTLGSVHRPSALVGRGAFGLGWEIE